MLARIKLLLSLIAPNALLLMLLIAGISFLFAPVFFQQNWPITLIRQSALIISAVLGFALIIKIDQGFAHYFRLHHYAKQGSLIQGRVSQQIPSRKHYVIIDFRWWDEATKTLYSGSTQPHPIDQMRQFQANKSIDLLIINHPHKQAIWKGEVSTFFS